MDNLIKSYFYGTKSELKAFLLLLIILIGVIFLRFFISNKTGKISQLKIETIENQVASITAATQKKTTKYTNNQVPLASTNTLFHFNPNTTSKSDFEKLGLSARTAQSIINYRNKGGKFFKSEDLKKIYTLNSSDYERLKTYINIPKTENLTASKSNTKYPEKNNYSTPKPDYIKKSTTVKIEINTAKTEDFQQLKGIGAGYAKRIIKYRDKLGGFTNIEQIKEVYGLEIETFEAVKEQLVIQEKELKKININTATYTDLVQHPYIDSKRANAIIKYRKQHGKYKSVDDLKKNYAISKVVFNQIKGYLTI